MELVRVAVVGGGKDAIGIIDMILRGQLRHIKTAQRVSWRNRAFRVMPGQALYDRLEPEC